jgi:GntR family transcriptional regulator/MocR family aminotransferase
VRRVRREYERRRASLLDAIAHHLPAGAQVTGTAAGLHVLLWVPFLRWEDERALVAAANDHGVGVYPVSPLFAETRPSAQSRAAGLILGYASLTVDEIQKGIRMLAAAIAEFRSERADP